MGWPSTALVLAFTCLAGKTFTAVQAKIDITCEPLPGNIIDWDCIFGPGSLSEVNKYESDDKNREKADFTSCKEGKDRPCSRFLVPKNVQRAETKVTFGPEGFPFLKNERYVFKYSFRAADGMKVAKKFTHIGQIKGAYHGKQTVDGDPIVSISANKEHGLHVRFSNQDTIEDYYTHDDWGRKWEDATGEWVHVTITTVFGQSMEVELAGGVSGKFVWPKHMTPVGWNDKGKMARMKLGLYHKEEMVGDADVEIRDISIEGPNGIIRTSPEKNTPSPSPSPSRTSVTSRPNTPKTETYCAPLEDNQIDWDCVFGPGSLSEVNKYVSDDKKKEKAKFTSCKEGKDRPCSRFIVPKNVQRAETKVTFGPEGFPFLKNERYVFKYSFRAADDMKVAKKFTHIGQIKGAYHGKQTVDGDPIVSISANNEHGLHVRFANQDTIEDYYTHDDWARKWEDAAGEWVHVTITTVFGQSMEVELAGGVTGTFVWPKHLTPVAWNDKGKMARMKLGLYHKEEMVGDADVEIRDISIEGPNGIIYTNPERHASTPSPSSSTKPVPSPSPTPTPGPSKSPSSSSDSGKTETYCAPLEDNQIDWDCVLGPDSLEEVDTKGGYMTTCPKVHSYACSLFVVKKEEERSEVKVQEGPEGFGFYKGECYTFKYSFRAKEGMKVSKRFTHLGQLKGSIGKGGGKMIKNDPIYSLTANKDGLMVRFSNLDKTIEDYHEGFEKHLDWGDSTGQWVHVRIRTTFGESMEVLLTGAVEGKAVWPSDLAPVAWHRDADRVRMKLGLYHKKNEVYDGEVEYKDITIEGPNGIVTTVQGLDSEGHLYLGCYEDARDERIMSKKYVDAHMTTAMCADLCEDSKYFGTQYANECWCSNSGDKPTRHGKSTNCNMKCAGGGTISKCGGKYAMDVYEHEGDPDDIPTGTKHLGCFADDVQDRALKLKSTKGSNMDYEECKKFCDKEDSRFFAVQYGIECFCGKSREKYDEHGPAICNMKCPGDSDQTCGGNKAMNVFRIKSD